MNNAQAQEALDKDEVLIDGIIVKENVIIKDDSEIIVAGKIARAKTEFIYIKLYKPAGYESTLGVKVPDNLLEFFKDYKGLSIAGRLDKASEGLLLLSNDGKWVENITNPKFEKEKEYQVLLDKAPNDEFVTLFEKGVNIGYHVTKPCVCKILKDNWINVVLKEGKNRQIRKMCKTLGYNVLTLKRTRIDGFKLDKLNAGNLELTKI